MVCLILFSKWLFNKLINKWMFKWIKDDDLVIFVEMVVIDNWLIELFCLYVF